MGYISLNFENYRHNLELLAKKAGGFDKLMVVLKDNAYGHGISEIAPLAAALGIKAVAVKNRQEALLVDVFFERVLILSDFPQSTDVKYEDWEFAVHSLDALKEIPQNIKVHVNVDTGMRRNGIKMDEIEDTFEIICEKNISLKGVFTHFRAADELDSSYFVQKARFGEVKNKFKEFASKHKLEDISYHSNNSAALLRSEDQFDEDFARTGIATYGYVELPESFGLFDLKPVMSLWAEKISTREIQKGDRVGYGGVFIANKKMEISTYDLGYGDGIFRYNGNKPLHVKDGREILGKMSMDSFVIAGNDREVCVFEDVKEFAKHFDTISYEIITKVSQTLPKRTTKLH